MSALSVSEVAPSPSRCRMSDAERERLLASVEAFIMQTAKRYLRPGIEMDDLLQSGRLGALRAMETFDPARGLTFLTYADMWIEQQIQRCVMNTGNTIRFPCWLHEDKCLPDLTVTPFSSFEGAQNDLKQLGTTADVEESEARMLIEKALCILSPRYRELVELHYLEGLTLKQIGARLGCSHENVRQRLGIALKRMRNFLAK